MLHNDTEEESIKFGRFELRSFDEPEAKKYANMHNSFGSGGMYLFCG